MTISTQKEGAKGTRWALAQIHWITLLEKRIHKILNPWWHPPCKQFNSQFSIFPIAAYVLSEMCVPWEPGLAAVPGAPASKKWLLPFPVHSRNLTAFSALNPTHQASTSVSFPAHQCYYIFLHPTWDLEARAASPHRQTLQHLGKETFQLRLAFLISVLAAAQPAQMVCTIDSGRAFI